MSECKIRPLHDNIVVRQKEAEDPVTAGGIVLPGTIDEKPFEAVVLAVGPGTVRPNGTFMPVTVKVGDRVLFGQYVGHEITLDKEDYLMLNEDEVIAILV